MTGEEFGFALLAAIKGKGHAVLKPMESVIREALGVKEEKASAPASIPPSWRSEWPQVRVKYDVSGNELGRRTVGSLEEFRQILREDPMFSTWLPER